MSSIVKQTPLYDIHKQAGATIEDYAGWEMPAEYSSVSEERDAVMTRAGLFDVSHIGRVFIFGKDTKAFLQKMMTDDMSELQRNKAQYNAMINADGQAHESFLIFKLEHDKYLILSEASNTEENVNWLKKHASGNVSVRNFTKEVSMLSVQGPRALDILQTLTSDDLGDIAFLGCKQHTDLSGIDVLVTRPGDTNEDDFHLILQAQKAPELWQAIISESEKYGLVPCGLRAKESLSS